MVFLLLVVLAIVVSNDLVGSDSRRRTEKINQIGNGGTEQSKKLLKVITNYQSVLKKDESKVSIRFDFEQTTNRMQAEQGKIYPKKLNN